MKWKCIKDCVATKGLSLKSDITVKIKKGDILKQELGRMLCPHTKLVRMRCVEWQAHKHAQAYNIEHASANNIIDIVIPSHPGHHHGELLLGYAPE